MTGEQKIEFKRILEALSHLDRKELLSYWIDQEVKEAEMYYHLYELSNEVNWDKRIPALFLRLYKESLKHAEILLGMFKEMFPEEQPPRVELPSLEVELSGEKLEEMVYRGKLRDILEYLMGTELLAHDVYEYLAEKTENEEIRATLLWLADIENGHYRKLKEAYTALFGEEGKKGSNP